MNNFLPHQKHFIQLSHFYYDLIQNYLSSSSFTKPITKLFQSFTFQTSRLSMKIDQNHETYNSNPQFSEELYNIDQMKTFYLQEWKQTKDWNDSPKRNKTINLQKIDKRGSQKQLLQCKSNNIETVSKYRTSSLPSISSLQILKSERPSKKPRQPKEYHIKVFETFQNSQITGQKLLFRQRQKELESKVILRRIQIEKKIMKQINQEIIKVKKSGKGKSLMQLIGLKKRSLNQEKTVEKELELINLKTKKIVDSYSHKHHLSNQKQLPNLHHKASNTKISSDTKKLGNKSISPLSQVHHLQFMERYQQNNHPKRTNQNDTHSQTKLAQKQHELKSKRSSINKILKKYENDHQLSIEDQIIALKQQQVQGRRSLIKQLASQRHQLALHSSCSAIQQLIKNKITLSLKKQYPSNDLNS